MSDKPLAAVPYLKIPEGADPYLEGHKCGNCGATFLGERDVCSKCGARDQMSKVTLPNTGKLYSYSIVYRSFLASKSLISAPLLISTTALLSKGT